MNSLIKRLNSIEEGLLALTFLSLAILTFLETLLRYTVSLTFFWFMEAANYTLIFATFLGASLGVKYGTHFSMEALTQATPYRISQLLKMIGYFVSGLICVFFVYFGIKHVLFLKSSGVRSSAMQLPMFIPYIPIPLFSATMGVRFFLLSFTHMKNLLKKETP